MRRLALVLAFCASPAALAVEPGNWEISIVSQLTGQPKPAAATQTRCMTEADARDPERLLGGQGSCEFSNKNHSGNLYSFDVRCTGLLPMKGRGKVSYTASTMEGEFDLQVEGSATPFGLQTFMKARRLGPC